MPSRREERALRESLRTRPPVYADPDLHPPIIDLLAPDQPPIQYLGDPNLIDALLRNFLAKAIDAQIEQQEEGTADVELVMAQEAQKAAKIVLGLDSDYVVISPQWNGPGVLNAIQRRWDLSDGNAFDIAAVPFYALVEAYQIALELEAKGEDWDHVIDGAIELSSAVLLGTEVLLDVP